MSTPLHKFLYAKSSNVLIYSDGGEYTGDVVDGKRQGNGVMTYSKGMRLPFEKEGFAPGNHMRVIEYNGMWNNDRKHGFGVVKYSNGKRIVGEYINDGLVGIYNE